MRAMGPGGALLLPGESPTHFQAFTGLFPVCQFLDSAHGYQITPAQKRGKVGRSLERPVPRRVSRV